MILYIYSLKYSKAISGWIWIGYGWKSLKAPLLSELLCVVNNVRERGSDYDFLFEGYSFCFCTTKFWKEKNIPQFHYHICMIPDSNTWNVKLSFWFGSAQYITDSFNNQTRWIFWQGKWNMYFISLYVQKNFSYSFQH